MVYGKLFMLLSPHDEREFVLEKQMVTLGRASDNDIVLPSPMISRHHARLQFSPDPLIEDVGSALGTSVGDQRIAEPCPLHSGDIISLAGVRLRFEAPRPDEIAPHTVVDLTDQAPAGLEKAALKATLTHTLLDAASDVAAEASRQDATLQVVVAESGPRLIIREEGISRDVRLGHEPLLIGRAAACQVVLSSGGCSRRHATVSPQGNEYVLTDTGSTNGTLVNGELIAGPHRLVDGDIITIGEAVIVYRGDKHDMLAPPLIHAEHRGGRQPVVFIPGLMGSELRRGRRVLWPNYPYLLSHPTALLPNSGPVEVAGIVSEVVVVPHFLKLDAYNRLTQYLETSMGYLLGIDLLEFPYDWRQDNRIIAGQLAAAIRSWRTTMGHGRVTIIAHSMGGLIARYYLDQLGGAEDVGRFIVMGTPHKGTAKIVATMLSGVGATPFDLAREKMRTVTLNGPSLYQILPRYPCVFDQAGKQVDLFADDSWLAEEHRPLLAGAAEFLAALHPQATVPTLCIFGYGRPTPSRIVVERQQQVLKLRRYDIEPVGDGGVVEESAILDGAEIHPVRQDHGALFTDPDVQRRLRYELMKH